MARWPTLLVTLLLRPCLLLSLDGPSTLIITRPVDGGLLVYVEGAERTMNTSMEYTYALARPADADALRICVEVQRSATGLNGAYVWFAEGCFSTKQPLTLVLPTHPAAFRVKAALADRSTLLAHGQTTFAIAPAPPFAPSYEWSLVPPGVSVPAGLEVQMALDGSGSIARIPDPFRLQISLAAHLGIFRGDVHRGTTMGALAALLDDHALRRLQLHPAELGTRACASVAMSVPVSDGSGSSRELTLPLGMTAEQCELFSNQSRLRITWHPCKDEPAPDESWPRGHG
ncbi:hypothetical protein KFE25_005998 [Diacronema lutheri]|uniref:Uncharacterized protein n=1 Tax=Diacronema lutheri TaxID=2081491 RepID=A0A8J5XQ49_DIALT|nr:hypothetical protein KFE25_005998 [Diacronema lutheri]